MKKKESTQVVGGAVISYILVILNAVYGLVLTPYILSTLGTAEYGVYKTVAALSASLMVLDLGLGGTTTRFIAKYKAEKNEKEMPNFISLMLMQAFAVIILVAVVCSVIYSLIGSIYSATFTAAQIDLAKKLFLILSANMMLHIMENVVNGIITGCNDFVFGNGVKLTRLIFRIVLIIVIIRYYASAVALVAIDLFMTALFLIVEIFWARFKHGIKVKYDHWDNSLFSESFVYTLLMFVSSIINQVNSNLDNVVIGAVVSAAAVTIYSMGLTIFSMFEQLSTSISGVMLPSITNMLYQENGMEKAKKLVIKVGRVQFGLLGAALVGFVVLGHDFIYLWLGDGFNDVYAITLILMLPSIFELCVNVCLSILRAKNMLGFRTVVLLCTTIINALITYFGTKAFGYFAACIGTAFSWTIGSLIAMNIYYYKKFGYNMIKIYGQILGKIWIGILLAGGATLISSHYISGSWLKLLVNVMVFCIVYVVCLGTFGLNLSEKDAFKKISRRI